MMSLSGRGRTGRAVAPNVARACGQHHTGKYSEAPALFDGVQGIEHPPEATVTETPTTPPALDELLKDAPSNWGKWGDDDEVGALNYLGPEQVLAAVKLVSQGKVFTLQRLIGDPKGDPVWPGRTPAERTQVLDESDWDEGGSGPAFPGGLHYADDKINAFLQGSTQYDGLGHVWYD